MHQKKSEVQIGKESSGISSDFNPTPPLLFNIQSTPHSFLSSSSDSNPHIIIHQLDDLIAPTLSPTPKTAAHKRPFTVTTRFVNPSSSYSSNCVSKSPTLSNISHNFQSSSTSPAKNNYPFRFHRPTAAAFQQLRRLRIHLRLVLLLSLPFFYFLLSHPSHSFLLNFLSAFAFSSVLLFSLNLALPRLPSIRLFFSRNFPIKLCSSRPPLLRFWSIGSRPNLGKRSNSGYCVQAYSNGDIYQGEFHKGKSSGNGVYYYHMSGKYEGDWVDGKYDGYGVETWARGSRYRGQYKLGLRHGFGVYRFYTGDIYAGEWANGQSHNCGVHTCEDGSQYVGEFKWGVKHGLGHYHFRNGDKYAGEYFSNKMHGYGVYTFAKGHRYEGGWHKGRRQGFGMYTFRHGETQSGNWENGILSIPSTQNPNYPVSPVAVYHSKVLNAVQEARRAAEKAYDVGKVDERVSRAVAAANRAANAGRVAAIKAVQKQLHLQNNNANTSLTILSTKNIRSSGY